MNARTLVDLRKSPARQRRVLTHTGRFCFAVMAVFLFVGCQSTSSENTGSVNTVERAEPVGRRQLLLDKRVIKDKSLADELGVVAVNQVMTPGGLLKVQLEVVNQSSSYRRFNYRFEWLDANGMLLNTPASTWVTEQLEGGESKFISGAAPTPDCQDFRVKLIKPTN